MSKETSEPHRTSAKDVVFKIESESLRLDPTEETTNSEQLAGGQLALVFGSFGLAFFVIAVDQTILATALPTIASHFNAVDDLSWIASAFFLPQAAFMLFFGKVLAFVPPKPVFLVAISIFEIGSLLSALAPSVVVLILGRAISGFGAVGLYVSIMSIVARVTTLNQRPLMMSIFGGVFAASSLGGPVIGGQFSDRVTWRWCFYINLPIGGLAIVAVIIALPHLPSIEKTRSVRLSFIHLDWLGTLLSLAFVTFLLIALQWAGNERPWNDGLVIAFLVLAGVSIVIFIAWEYRRGDDALLPVNMLVHKNVLCASLSALFGHICFTIFTYYTPLLYQLRGHSATRSGVDIFPFMISGVLATIVAGGIASGTGHAWPFLVISPLIAAVGFGLFYTVDQATGSGRMAGLQILIGVGIGCVTQLPIVVAQAQYADKDLEHLIPQATSFSTFLQLIGSSLGLPIASAVFSASLSSNLRAASATATLSADTINAIHSSVKAVFDLLPPGSAGRVVAVTAYVDAIRSVWLVCIPSAALASAAAVFISRGRLRKLEGGS